jgi:tetratricopeptide (TPR) repeat protein
MLAAGQRGIPCSFIVDKEGKIAWIGHPMSMERPLAKVLEGTFDAKAEAELQEKVSSMNKEAMELTTKKEYDKALKLRDEIAKLNPEAADSQEFGKLNILMLKGDADAVNKLAGELLEKAEKEKESMIAARVASLLLNGAAAEKSDKALALKAAKLAFAGNEKTVSYQLMLAQAYAANKEFEKAIELQEKVVSQVNGPIKVREQKKLDQWKEAAKTGAERPV